MILLSAMPILLATPFEEDAARLTAAGWMGMVEGGGASGTTRWPRAHLARQHPERGPALTPLASSTMCGRRSPPGGGSRQQVCGGHDAGAGTSASPLPAGESGNGSAKTPVCRRPLVTRGWGRRLGCGRHFNSGSGPTAFGGGSPGLEMFVTTSPSSCLAGRFLPNNLAPAAP